MYKALLSLCGVGFSHFFPGTMASLVSVFILLGYQKLLPSNTVYQVVIWLVTFAVVYLFAWLLIKRNIKNDYDKQWIVIDEFLGMMIVYLPFLFIDLNYWYLALLVFLFRIFDILKPWGIKSIDRKDTPNSVLLDDVLAGGYALVIFVLVILYIG